MNQEVVISIIIATYNAEKTLQKCLGSIIPQLTEQTELIIVDGASKDSTNEIISFNKKNVAYTISEPDKGIYDAWNKGINVARGKWIAFIGADDILLPDAIDNYLRFIRNTNDIDSYDYICAHVEYVDKSGKLLKVLGMEPQWCNMRKFMAPAHVASLHNKKNLFEMIGDYDFQNYRICADYELLLRKKDKLKYIMLPTHIAQMEIGGMSFSTKAIKETFLIRRKHHTVSLFFNVLLFIKDWVAYKSFLLRH